MLVLQRMTHTDPPEPNIPSWSEGTDAEIVEALKLHYQGKIDLTKYWSAGLDERVVHLSAMNSQYTDESHIEQDVVLVLMNAGGKTLATPINGKTECAFIVGQKNVLASGTSYASKESGYINSTAITTGGWDSSSRRTWCNEIYYNAIPSTLRSIFKEFVNRTGNGDNSTYTDSIDYFALPALKEVQGVDADYTIGEENLIQFKWYKTSSNRLKYIGDGDNSTEYWLRSPTKTSGNFWYNQNATMYGGIGANTKMGISPFGVI